VEEEAGVMAGKLRMGVVKRDVVTRRGRRRKGENILDAVGLGWLWKVSEQLVDGWSWNSESMRNHMDVFIRICIYIYILSCFENSKVPIPLPFPPT